MLKSKVFGFSRKPTISFFMYVGLSAHPHGTTQLPLDKFSWNLMLAYFSQICRD